MERSSTRKPICARVRYMQSVISCMQSQRLDQLSQRHIPAIIMMEHAACLMRQQMEHDFRIRKETDILFLVGPGNNGGDALALARALAAEGFTSLKVLCLSPKSELCTIQHEAILDFPIRKVEAEEIAHAEVIVDGLFGVGLTRPVEAPAKDWIERANANRTACKIAIDIPSGISDDIPVSALSFHADVTYTMGLAKSCMFHPSTCGGCGRVIKVLNPSFPPSLIARSPVVGQWESIAMAHEAPFPLDAFKNNRGSVAVFAGSRLYSGAARLSCQAAFHAGSGLVTLFADEASYPVVAASGGLSVMVRHEQEADDLFRYDAILAGPGWGPNRKDLLQRILDCGKPVVVDADGLSALTQLVQAGYRSKSPLVLTPHVGELVRLSSSLLGKDIVHESPAMLNQGLMELSARLGAVIVLKSAVNQIVQDTRMVFLDCKNPAIAVAGSGDVLGGIILSLLGQKMDPFEAALTGCRLHQWKGKVLAREGYFTSQELEESL